MDTDALPATSRPSFALAVETPVALSHDHQAALLRAALARHPGNAVLREKLAFLLLDDDDFDGAIALFEPLVAERPRLASLLALHDAYLARRTAADDRRAETVAREALAVAANDRQRAAALAALGKALMRQARPDEARAVLTEALAADRHHVDAYKRLAAIVRAEEPAPAGRAAELAAAEALIAEGVAHAYLLGSRAAALAVAGRIDEARAAIGLDRFLDRRTVAPPAPWPTLDAFNAAIRAELARHPGVRYDRHGTASTMTWRIDRPLVAGSPALVALGETVRAAIVDYVARHPDDAAPWSGARPAAGLLHHSCVMTDADGYENWHLHQHGWLSGVYYVDVPERVSAGDDRAGCLAFGLPEELVGAEAAVAYGEQLVRPEPGLLLLFPSHAYHRTFAHGSDARRICLAFDVRAG